MQLFKGCIKEYNIYFLGSEQKQAAGKHIAKVQTASIRCVENPLSGKLFAQGQQQRWRGQNENENENDSGRANTTEWAKTNRFPRYYASAFSPHNHFRLPNVLENFLLPARIKNVQEKNLRGHFCAKKRATLFFNGSLGAFMS